jgi:hypothetical protein
VKTAAAAATPAATETKDAGSDSEEEDEDDMGEMAEFVPKARPAGRRVSVSAGKCIVVPRARTLYHARGRILTLPPLFIQNPWTLRR